MTPEALTDQRVISAVAHPVRRQILAFLSEDAASATEIAKRLGMSVPKVSYHMSRLRELGLLELVSETPRRGAIERHYRADRRTATNAWEVIAAVLSASDAGARGVAVEAKSLTIDRQGREDVAKATARYWDQLDAIASASARRLAKGQGRPIALSVGVIRGAPPRT
jgi:DNA-binding transcriptional ArsR family regulator